MTILELPLNTSSYEMIERGEKNEEYRDYRPYWTDRLHRQNYTHVRFRYGYTRRSMIYEIESITTGKGKIEWGAPDSDKDVYIIKVGKRTDAVLQRQSVWLARDKSGRLFVYEKSPVKGESFFLNSGSPYSEINSAFLPDVTFENSPVRLEIQISSR